MTVPEERRRGCLMVGHGDAYRRLARLCVRYFKAYNPSIPVRLYTDEEVNDENFDEVVILGDVWHRSRIDAMIDSPFEQTLCLDVDALTILDIRDGFELLDVHDFALCHDPGRNHESVVAGNARGFPNAYPQLNPGVLFFRRTPDVRSFLETWRNRVESSGSSRDQPAFRELAYDTRLRIAVLPPEYNFIGQTIIAHRDLTAPRVIHAPRLHADPVLANSPYPVLHYLGPRNYARLLDAVENDHYVRESGSVPAYTAFGKGWPPTRRLIALKFLHFLLERRARGQSYLSSMLPMDLSMI